MTDKTELTAKTTLLALISLAIIVLFLGLLVWVTFTSLSSLSAQVSVPVLAAIITAAASVYVVVKTKQSDRKKEIEQELRKQKAPIYEDFSSFLFKLLKSEKMGRPPSGKEMLDFIVKFHQRLLVWGDDAVIKEWSNFKRFSNDPEKQKNFEIVFQVERILFAIRADMGHSNKGLKAGDLLALFVNDIDEAMQKRGI